MWHIAPNKPAPINPLCGVFLDASISLIRQEEYERQIDPWNVYGSSICEPCARAAAHDCLTAHRTDAEMEQCPMYQRQQRAWETVAAAHTS